MRPKPLSLVHLIREPAHKAEQPAPLLLLLHGVGSHEGDLMSLAPYLDERFFIASPRAPITLTPGSYAWYHVAFTSSGPVIDPAEAEAAQDAVIRFTAEATEAYGLDPNGIYLMGFSQGAILSLSLALTRPDLLAGVVAISGRTLPQSVPSGAPPPGMEGLPIFIAHGTEDAILPINYARDSRDIFSRLPVSLTYREYPMGHGISAGLLADASEWLAEVVGGQQ